MYASSEGSDETVQTHSLVRALAAQQCDKSQNLVKWSISLDIVPHLTKLVFSAVVETLLLSAKATKVHFLHGAAL